MKECPWSNYLPLLRTHGDDIEKKSIFHGTAKPSGAPVLLPIELWKENVWIRGDPGSGKTAQMAAVMEQLVAIEPCTIIILDLKGSPELLATAMTLRPDATKHFINLVGFSTYVCNFLEQPGWKKLTPDQRAAILASAFEVDYGGSTNYGASWFGDAGYENYTALFERIPDFKNFGELDEKLIKELKSAKLDPEVRRAGLHAKLACKRFSRVQALNAKNSIDLEECFYRPQILYFCLPKDLGGKTNSDIARFLACIVLMLANLLPNSPDRLPVYLFVDEFQRALGPKFLDGIAVARSKGLSCILAHQTIGQLQTLGPGAANIMSSCCRVHWTFAVGDTEEQERIARQSGQILQHLNTVSSGSSWTTYTDAVRSHSVSQTETLLPAFSINEIKTISSTPGMILLRCTRNAGYAQFNDQFIPVQTYFHIDREEFERRKNFPWPEAREGCITTTMPTPVTEDEYPEFLFPPSTRGKRQSLSTPPGEKK